MIMRQRIVLLSLLLSLPHADAVPSTFLPSSFVPPAAPTIASNTKAIPIQILANRLLTGYGTFSPNKNTSPQLSNTALFAKRKTIKTKDGKVQVKLLKNVPGTGNQGEVVTVAPAFFENKLKRSQSAVLVSDDEVTEMKEKREKLEKELLDSAKDMKKHLDDFELVLKRKCGPEGHLFGGVGNKVIMDELKKEFPKGALDGKKVKVTVVKDEDGGELKHDIKEIGTYKATISLLKDISADVSISILEE